MAERPKTEPRRIRTASELGTVVREARKKNEFDQETTADLVGVGPRFLGELERVSGERCGASRTEPPFRSREAHCSEHLKRDST